MQEFILDIGGTRLMLAGIIMGGIGAIGLMIAPKISDDSKWADRIFWWSVILNVGCIAPFFAAAWTTTVN